MVDHHALQWETWILNRSMKAIALEAGILNAKCDIESYMLNDIECDIMTLQEKVLGKNPNLAISNNI